MARGWVFRGARVAVIGGGRIGSAIALALRGCGARVHVTARSRETIERLRGLGLEAGTCNPCAVRASDYIFLAVKPHQFPPVAREVGGLAAGKAVVSVMAAVPARVLEAALPGAEVYRAMPSIGARIGRSLTALYSPPGARRRREVRELLSCLGEVYEVPEELLDAWTAVAGSGPAIVAEFLDALILASLAVGLPRSLAREVALALLDSTAAYLRSGGLHPAELRDEVATPAGTTVAAIGVLEARGFKSAVMEAIRAAARRAAEMAREIEEAAARELSQGRARP